MAKNTGYEFKPHTLQRGDETREVTTAEQETKLRYDGWHSVRGDKKAEAPKPSAPKSPEK